MLHFITDDKPSKINNTDMPKLLRRCISLFLSLPACDPGRFRSELTSLETEIDPLNFKIMDHFFSNKRP